jgi:hypothetical protein
MPRSRKQIRKTMDIKLTPQGKGLATTISLIAYDKGMIQVNGTPVRGTNNWPMAIEVIVSMVNEFYAQVEQRKHRTATAPPTGRPLKLSIPTGSKKKR